MSIFGQLFGKKQKEPETLESKISKLDEQSQLELEALVASETGGSEGAVLRKAALEKLPYGDKLVKVALGGENIQPELEKTARKKIADQIESNALDVNTVLGDIDNTEALLAIAAFCSSEILENEVFNKINNESDLADICINSHSARVRQTLASRIQEPDLLKKIANALKNKDKNAYKIVKGKMDDYKAEDAQRLDIESKITELLEEMDQLSKRAFDKEFILRFERAQRRWPQVEQSASQEVRVRFEKAKEISARKIADYEAEQKAIKDREEKISKLAGEREKLLFNLNDFINEICALELASEESLDALMARLQGIKDQWQSFRDLEKPKTHQMKSYTQLTELAEQLFVDFASSGSLIECQEKIKQLEDQEAQRVQTKYQKRIINHLMSVEFFEPGQAIRDILTELQGIDADYKTYQENRQKLTRIIGGLIKKSSQSVQSGRLKQAIGIRHSIEEKAQDLDDLPSHITRQLEGLDEEIQKLVDWQSYAVVPKKESLIAAMEKLIGAEMPPEALATKIKNLQEEWRSLSQSGKDRNEDLWEKFSELADKAFEPCKEHYKTLSDERSVNLEKRKTLVRQLEDFYANYDWENADWKNVETIIRTAHSEIRAYSPVDRAANKEVSVSFDSALKNIQDKLNAELEKNKAAKQQIIMQAEKLPEMADVQQGIEAAKRLQVQWKSIGRTHYRDNDKLWKEFRKHCDAVFEKKDKIYADRRAEEDEKINAARKIIDQLKGLSNLPSEDVLVARSERDELQTAFGEIEGVPEKVWPALQKDFAKAADKFDKRVGEVVKENEAQAWQDFFTVGEKMASYFSCISEDEAKTQKQEILDFVDSVKHWPEGTNSTIKEKLQTLEDREVDSKHIDDYKLLCIRVEILAGVESPSEDKAKRMEYQVSLLQKGLGQQAVQEGNTPASLAKEWIQLSPIQEGEYQKLYKRFYESWKKI